VASLLSSLRYLLADIIGEDDATPPFLPEGLPDRAAALVSESIDRLNDYQGPGYARLYVDRLRRFVGRREVDDALLVDIARLMAMRMSYEDPIRIAQLKLAEPPGPDDVRKFRLDELIGALPVVVADPLLAVFEWVGWVRRQRVSIRFSNRSRWGIRRLKIEASLKRWRKFSEHYGKERVWVERWLHMIDRGLTKQPAAVPAIVQTATMIKGYGDSYRQGMADWNAVIDGLVKPTFDGVLALSDLAGAILEARAVVLSDPRQAALKRTIAEIRARVPAGPNAAAD
jgi:hypothetical protein